jgi:hypothetical protein
MHKLDVIAAALALPLVFAQGCGDDGATSEGASDTNDTSDQQEVCDGEISGTIESDTTWTCGHSLSGIVTVKNNATLTIMPGVTIKGLNGSALVVAKGSRLIAEGTQDQPIVFTSAQAPGTRARGDWGGVVLLGDAANNLVNGAGSAEGLDASDPTYQYGGSDDAYSCGSLKWLRVEFAGFELTKDNELNGITFYSCGTGTTVEYIQAHMGKDDGIEMFGGHWNGKHIVITGALDDSVDIDQGYTGNLQHIFIHQEPSAGNYAFELSNQKDNLDADPRTRPIIANVTAIGTGVADPVETASGGLRLKEGVAAEVHNAIFTYFHNAAVELTEGQTETQATSGAIKIQHSLFWNNSVVDGGKTPWAVDDSSTFDLAAFVGDAANMNHVDVDPQLGSYAFGSADAAPRAGSPVLGKGQAPTGFDAADYIGAVKDSASDWTKGWTESALN